MNYSTSPTSLIPQSCSREHTPDPRAWLAHIPPARRSTIANWYHYAVRNGANSPAAVVSHVQQTAQRRLQWASDAIEEARLRTVLEALQADRPGAFIYTQSVIDYERLPYDQRQRVKATRATPYLREAMRDKPVTEKQAACLRAMGYTGPQPADRAAASALIDTLKRGGRP